MLTRWGAELDADHPWPQHPRPQLVRDSWLSLNGRWEHGFTSTPEQPVAWAPIVVPFSPESALSGVGRQLQPEEWLWYRRRLPRPPTGDRLLLHLGAVDQSCTVLLDGVEVGGHTGGYLPFTLDVTGAAEGSLLEVRVRDLSETGVHARGKQRLDRGGIWYTAQSGIWQSVWLEAVPELHVTDIQHVADLNAGAVVLTVHTSRPTDVEVHLDGRCTTVRSGDRTSIALDDPRHWTPESPHLHELTARCGEDEVRSYVALRTCGTGTDPDGRRVFLLNGVPRQLVGVLDQGYWPDGLLTPPSDAALVHELTRVRDLGFDLVRKHAKVEPLRWYHHCDRLGLLVWQDVVNGGGRYRDLVTQRPSRHPVALPDRLHRLYRRGDAGGRDELEAEVLATLALLGPSPSVVLWTLFNEGWGQFDSRRLTRVAKRLDPTRPVTSASGWVDHGTGDVRAVHRYAEPFRLPRRRRSDRRVWVLAEYGGHALTVADHHEASKPFGYRRFRDAAALARAFEALHVDHVLPAVRRGLAATVWTQLSDVEDELNGLLTYDREVLKLDPDLIRRVCADLRSPPWSPAARVGSSGPAAR